MLLKSLWQLLCGEENLCLVFPCKPRVLCLKQENYGKGEPREGEFILCRVTQVSQLTEKGRKPQAPCCLARLMATGKSCTQWPVGDKRDAWAQNERCHYFRLYIRNHVHSSAETLLMAFLSPLSETVNGFLFYLKLKFHASDVFSTLYLRQFLDVGV